MSRGNRLRQLADRGCLIAGVILLAGGVGPCESQDAIQERPAPIASISESSPKQQRGGVNPADEAQDNTPAPPILSEPTRQQESAPVTEARCQEAYENGLVTEPCQQWRMVIAADRQIYWTQVEIGLLIGTLALSALAAWAAVCAVRIAKDTSKKELRAYLALTPAGFKFHRLNGTFDAVVSQQNSGQTPAFKVRLFTKVERHPHPLPSNYSFPIPDFGESRNTVHPGHSYNTPARADERFEIEEIYGMQMIGDRFYVLSVIEYYDIYDERRETRACWSLDVLPSDIETIEPGETRQAPFIYTAEHNDAT